MVFEPGETEKEVIVKIIDDQIEETSEWYPNETFEVQFSNLSGNANWGSNNTYCIVTIIDNDGAAPTVEFATTEYNLSEGDGSVTLTVSLSAIAPPPVTVNTTTTDDTATGGQDYEISAGTLTFALGETSKTIVVPIINDTAPESTETFKVTLSNASGATLGSNSVATVSVADDDTQSGVTTVIVTATNGTFSPSSFEIEAEVTTTLSAKAETPDPEAPVTISGPTWNWQVVSAQYSEISQTGPWLNGTGIGSCTIEPLTSPEPVGTYDYSLVKVSGYFLRGGYWNVSCDANASYSDSNEASYVGSGSGKAQGTAVEIGLLTVISGATQTNVIGSTNWASVCKPQGTKAIIEATLIPRYGDVNVLRWLGGESVSSWPDRRAVDLYESKATTVTAKTGSVSKSVTIWAIWADVTIATTGKISADNNAVALVSGNWPTLMSDGSSLGGGNDLGETDQNLTPGLNYRYAIGRIEARGKLTPAGIGAIISPTSWNFPRYMCNKAWQNGNLYLDRSDLFTKPAEEWKYDIQPKKRWQDLNPSSGGSIDTIYDLDAPGCDIELRDVNRTGEHYLNFYQWITVDLDSSGQRCSYYTKWSWQARVDMDKVGANKTDLNKLETNHVT